MGRSRTKDCENMPEDTLTAERIEAMAKAAKNPWDMAPSSLWRTLAVGSKECSHRGSSVFARSDPGKCHHWSNYFRIPQKTPKLALETERFDGLEHIWVSIPSGSHYQSPDL